MLISPSHVPPDQSDKGKKVHEFISVHRQEPNAPPRIMRRSLSPSSKLTICPRGTRFPEGRLVPRARGRSTSMKRWITPRAPSEDGERMRISLVLAGRIKLIRRFRTFRGIDLLTILLPSPHRQPREEWRCAPRPVRSPHYRPNCRHACLTPIVTELSGQGCPFWLAPWDSTGSALKMVRAARAIV